MEDAAICEVDIGDGNALFAVFDGHGGKKQQRLRNVSQQICGEDLYWTTQKLKTVSIKQIC